MELEKNIIHVANGQITITCGFSELFSNAEGEEFSMQAFTFYPNREKLTVALQYGQLDPNNPFSYIFFREGNVLDCPQAYQQLASLYGENVDLGFLHLSGTYHCYGTFDSDYFNFLHDLVADFKVMNFSKLHDF